MPVTAMALLSVLLVNGLHAGVVAPGLQVRLESVGSDESVRVLVVLAEQLDVQAIDRDLKSARVTRRERHAGIVGPLQQHAVKHQAPLLAYLESVLKSTGGAAVRAYHPHWLINAVVVTATPGAIRALAARADVERIEADLVPEAVAPVRATLPEAAEAAGVGLADGVRVLGVPRVWDELGIDGTGTLVGLIDSGADGGHPALASRWQGHFAPAATAWCDAAQTGATVPTDPHFHGTHVLGTMTGRAPGDTIGVAPGARWLAANGVHASWVLFDNAILASLEFMTDPDGDPTTTDDVPDVVNNSWGLSALRDDYPDCDSRWWQAFENCEAAGVVLIWAAGNEGPATGTVRPPADRASGPYDTFAVGSTETADPFAVSDFSSRGPSACGGADAVKPEVAAPGEEIYSASPGGAYQIMSGTSMSSAHVSGVVALMRQANPDVDVVTIKHILMATARDLGPAGEDNETGHGLIDAHAAVQAVLNGLGAVSGQVRDAADGQPVPFALISRVDAGAVATADRNGRYRIETFTGPATISASAFGYTTAESTFEVIGGNEVVADLVLARQTAITVSGTVRGPDSQPVQGATVLAVGTPAPAATTGADGSYSLDLPPGAYSLRAEAAGFGYQVLSVDLAASVTVDFDLPEISWDDFETGGFLALPWQFAGDAPWAIDDAGAYEGVYSARAGIIDDSQASTILLDQYVLEPGELAFHYRVSSLEDSDYLEFSVDGVRYVEWSGETGWRSFETTIGAGRHVFRWTYRKDVSVVGGDDTAWIDLVRMPPTGEEPRAELVLDTTPVTVTLAAGATATRSLIIGNAGNTDLGFATSIDAATEPNEPADDGTGTLVRTPQEVPWVTIAPSSGVAAPGISVETTLTFNAEGAGSGPKLALLTVTCNDPARPQSVVPLVLTVDNQSEVPAQDPPGAVHLRGAVPNPFNPRTSIRFSLRQEGRVKLIVFDVMGRRVRTLVDRTMPAGRHAVDWDGRDGLGKDVSTGTYFARLTVGGESRAAAMTVMR